MHATRYNVTTSRRKETALRLHPYLPLAVPYEGRQDACLEPKYKQIEHLLLLTVWKSGEAKLAYTRLMSRT
jgi:hypothetical protein